MAKRITSYISDIIRGKVLIDKDMRPKWIFMGYIFLFFLISITMSHYVDETVVQISNEKEQTDRVKAKYILLKRDLMSLKVESELEKIVSKDSLFAIDKQPEKIIIPKLNVGEQK